MQLAVAVKTLKGEKFTVNAEETNTIAEVKTIIEVEKPELPAASMKLIHSGKVLEDTETIADCQLNPNDLLVVKISGVQEFSVQVSDLEDMLNVVKNQLLEVEKLEQPSEENLEHTSKRSKKLSDTEKLKLLFESFMNLCSKVEEAKYHAIKLDHHIHEIEDSLENEEETAREVELVIEGSSALRRGALLMATTPVTMTATAAAPPQNTGIMIKVFFGTNRILNTDKTGEVIQLDTEYGYGKGKHKVHFENGRTDWTKSKTTRDSENVTVGKVNVFLEDQRSPTEKAMFWKQQARYIHNITIFGKDNEESYKKLLNELNTDREKLNPDSDILVFIHGFNVSFEDAANTAAKLQNELKIQTAFFSWPSKASLGAYSVDEACIGASEQAFTKFLLHLLKFKFSEPNKRVHIIAHSMGNRGLVRALQRIQARGEKGLKFGHVIFAAADVDAQLFVDLAKSSFVGLADGYTLYTAEGDKALGCSGFVHAQPRVGRYVPYTVVDEVVDTIAVSSDIVHSVVGHSYFVEAEVVLDDISKIINGSERAITRVSDIANCYKLE